MIAHLPLTASIAAAGAGMVSVYGGGILASLACGLWAPAPWLLALTLVLVHTLTWAASFFLLIRQRAQVAIASR